MTNLKELISVIVCTYNQQDTIGRTLDSILSQECHLPFEIIIGEDCSTDNTLAICKQYGQKHPNVIRVIANPSNKGFVRNYFDCLRACKGKYIATSPRCIYNEEFGRRRHLCWQIEKA